MATVDQPDRSLRCRSASSAPCAPLRIRVGIARAAQNRLILARGQQMQLKLPSPAEGSSTAAVPYHVVRLLLYGAKAAKAAGLSIQPEFEASKLFPPALRGG